VSAPLTTEHEFLARIEAIRQNAGIVDDAAVITTKAAAPGPAPTKYELMAQAVARAIKSAVAPLAARIVTLEEQQRIRQADTALADAQKTISDLRERVATLEALDGVRHGTAP